MYIERMVAEVAEVKARREKVLAVLQKAEDELKRRYVTMILVRAPAYGESGNVVVKLWHELVSTRLYMDHRGYLMVRGATVWMVNSAVTKALAQVAVEIDAMVAHAREQ